MSSLLLEQILKRRLRWWRIQLELMFVCVSDYPSANDLALGKEVAAPGADRAEVAEIFPLQCEEDLDVQLCW
jgi:hypothetical protein